MDEPLPEADCLEGAPHPRQSAHLFGQDRAAETFLAAQATGRLHHAWLVTGPKGVGKATLAWRIARFVLDGRMVSGPVRSELLYMDPEEPTFRRLAALSDPRLILLRRRYDEEKKRFKTAITVDEIRKLSGFFNLSAADGGWRVAIIDAADEMNTAAANALLKLLEEPPSDTLILLISHQPGRLLPTIRSRCRNLACDSLNEADLALALDACGFSLPPEMTSIQQLADGSVGAALSLVQNGGEDLYARVIDTLSTIPRMDRGKVLELAEDCAQRGAEKTYEQTTQLVMTALARLAKTAATGQALPEAAPTEGETFVKLTGSGNTGHSWADLSQTLATKTAHARSVNLDPSSVILDMFLQIEATAARIQ